MLLCPFQGQLGSHLTQCGLRRGLPQYQVASWSIQPLGHNRHGPKSGGGAVPLFSGSWIPSNTMWRALRPTSIPSGMLIHPAVSPQRTWAENWEGCALFGGQGAGSPANTVWPGPRPTCVPNFILIYPTVWPQYTNITDRQTYRQTGQQSYSIRWTVLETVARKSGAVIFYSVK